MSRTFKISGTLIVNVYRYIVRTEDWTNNATEVQNVHIRVGKVLGEPENILVLKLPTVLLGHANSSLLFFCSLRFLPESTPFGFTLGPSCPWPIFLAMYDTLGT